MEHTHAAGLAAPGRSGDGAAFETFSDEIARLSDTILACERLCLLSARGLADLAVSEGMEGTPVAFIPGVSQNLLGRPTWQQHRTTSAQCIAALQGLLPVMGRFQLGTHESKGLAFHPIERGSAQGFKLKPLSARIRHKIELGLKALGSPPAASANSPTFHEHPYRAALVLRAMTPSQGVFSETWWHALFFVVWYLHQRKGHRRGMPNIQATTTPSTAFLTSHCVDAIETVQVVFKRRFERVEQLMGLLLQLKDRRDTARWLARAETKEIIFDGTPELPVIHAAYRHQTSILVPEAKALLEELACDSALPDLYARWLEQVRKGNGDTDAETFLRDVVTGIQHAYQQEQSKDEREKISKTAEDSIASIDRRMNAIRAIAGAVAKGELANPADLTLLPGWTCTPDYREATLNGLKNSAKGPDLLAEHWARHLNAAENARKTVGRFKSYLDDVLKLTADFSEPNRSGIADDSDVDRFLDKRRRSTVNLPTVEQQLVGDMEMGARWAELVLNRQLAYAAGSAMAQFDPSELAHAIKVVCRDGGRFRFAILLRALHAVCDAQRPDGAWNCEQPFHWTENGASMSPMSIEIASALISAVTVLVMNPERYGASQIEISTGLRPVNAALDRFFRWLSGSIQSFPLPACLREGETEGAAPMLYGWCSDRVPELSRIHSWATAAAIGLLVDFRRLLQERINLLLRVEFVSHHPSDLLPLSKVDPTDLLKVPQPPESGPTISRLMAFVREHKKLELAETAWLPKMPPEADISFWSGLFYGPPGTSKTFLAEAIAAELKWPLISVSPSDFLSKGDNLIEARAQEIFYAFGAASRVVLFFDEIDELIRDRSGNENDQRSALSFLTPSFLTKLQDLRRAAKKNEFIFILATNYKDRIDSAAIRSGRIDQQMCVVYPDRASRANIVLNEIARLASNENEKEKCEFTSTFVTKVKERLGKLAEKEDDAGTKKSLEDFSRNVVGFLAEFTGFLSYQRIQDFCRKHLVRPLIGGRDGKSGEADNVLALFRALRDVNAKEPGRFRPEISLREYAARPNAGEELDELLAVIPDHALPFGGLPQRARQMEDLKAAIGSIPTGRPRLDITKLTSSANAAAPAKP